MLSLIGLNLDNEQTIEVKSDILPPKICAHCNYTGDQLYLSGVAFPYEDPDDTERDILLVTFCQYCKKVTLHFYIEEIDFGDTKYELVSTIPKLKSPMTLQNLSVELQNKFPDFFTIFKQSQEAELNNLDHLAGMGYRKSLEFLVTDFLLEYLPEGTSVDWLTDPSTTLNQKIGKLPSERIRKLSTAISYLGNDETHYTRRHPEHGITSIKVFINALLSDMDNEIVLLDAEKILNKPKS